jgi:hypothetical protein
MGRSVICYMDKTDWDYELGEALDGNKLYPSIEDLEKNQDCVKSGGCGIVKVEVKLVEVVIKSDYKMRVEKVNIKLELEKEKKRRLKNENRNNS